VQTPITEIVLSI